MTDDGRRLRVYQIRLALGDGVRTPMPMDAFAALLNERGETTRFDSSKVSRMETGERKVSIDDVPYIAAVDPKRRGRDWLAWGILQEPEMSVADTMKSLAKEAGKKKA